MWGLYLQLFYLSTIALLQLTLPQSLSNFLFFAKLAREFSTCSHAQHLHLWQTWKRPALSAIVVFFIITCPKHSQVISLVHLIAATGQGSSRHCKLALGRGLHPQTELNPSPKGVLGPSWYQKGSFFLHVLRLKILRHVSCGLGAGRACVLQIHQERTICYVLTVGQLDHQTKGNRALESWGCLYPPVWLCLHFNFLFFFA